MLNGILIVRKEKEYTSNDVVAKLRGICRQKKIGHTGTLDPNATGVLLVCLGNATKLCGMFTDDTKEYAAELTLGKTTDTEDIWGNVLSDSGEKWKELSEDEIRKTVTSFQGRQMQVPPMYSALKVNGKRLYELARAGVEVERKAREIEIEEIEILPPEFSALPKLRIRVVCSKGTYIRTLCRDIGEKLGCGAVMSALTRTRVGNFHLKDAYSLDEIEKLRDEGTLKDVLIPVEEIFTEYPAVTVLQKGEKLLENGNALPFSLLSENRADRLSDGAALRVYRMNGTFYGVYRVQKEKKTIKPWKLFLPEG